MVFHAPSCFARSSGSGTGGFAFFGESTLPISNDLGGVRLRVRDGDDASCLNLNRAQSPRLLGVDPNAMSARKAFLAKEDVWQLLKQELPNGAVPALTGDADTLMWGLEKYGTLPWMANPSRINLKENSLILAHCTVPCSLVKSYNLRSHFESGIGVGIQGEFPLQDVMLFRLGGKELDLIWKAEGTIIQTGHAENLCRTQIKVKLDDEYSVHDLLTDPLGNHLIVVNSNRAF